MSEDRESNSRKNRDSSGVAQRVDEEHVELARKAHRSCPVARYTRGAFLFQMRLDPIECSLIVRPNQFSDDARFEHTMREINVANFFARGARHKNASLGYRFQPALGNQSMQHLTDTLTRHVKNGGQPMLWQFRARRQPPFEKGAGQRRRGRRPRAPPRRARLQRAAPAHPCASWCLLVVDAG